uniref:Uncharacterized protein n=1 Tax=Arundo donax TaxID=35708 RepID=A0A0A9C1P4_ARUDO
MHCALGGNWAIHLCI